MFGDPLFGSNKVTRARLLHIALLVFAVRAIIPIGYMPGSIADGTPFELCPIGNRAIASYLASDSQNQGHHHAHESNADSASAWEQCSFAGVAPVDGALPEAPVHAVPPRRNSFLPGVAVRVALPIYMARKARGPPVLSRNNG